LAEFDILFLSILILRWDWSCRAIKRCFLLMGLFVLLSVYLS